MLYFVEDVMRIYSFNIYRQAALATEITAHAMAAVPAVRSGYIIEVDFLFNR
ncbi:hypothetical protein GGQ60_002896 [Pedobacter zeae]|uniref:Uncharacterized protein n=1 Tax=Pedobacter zeae TaxID=1737356 RepID=A0A7W6KE54_9SPHI|nr:hypothetical protein [Pedobacter zeae]